MKNRRDSERSYTYAKIVINEIDILGYVRDISRDGIRIEVFDTVELNGGEEMIATIIPDQDLDIEPFNLAVQIRWSRENTPTTSVGLHVVSHRSKLSKEHFNRLFRVFKKAKEEKHDTSLE